MNAVTESKYVSNLVFHALCKLLTTLYRSKCEDGWSESREGRGGGGRRGGYMAPC